MADQIIAPVLSVKLSAEVLEKARSVKVIGAKMADVDQAFGVIVEETASNVARIMGTEPTFDFWNQVSYEFRVAYMEKRKCASKTADNRWSDVTRYMEEKFGLKKPTAPTVAADKKAKERLAQEKKVKAAKAQCTDAKVAIEKANELMAQGKINEAKVYQAASVALTKEKIEDVKKQQKEKSTKLKTSIKEAIAKCDDLATLEAVLRLIKDGVSTVAPKQASPAKPKRVAKEKATA
jgi:hypothetical protein